MMNLLRHVIIGSYEGVAPHVMVDALANHYELRTMFGAETHNMSSTVREAMSERRRRCGWYHVWMDVRGEIAYRRLP